MSDVPTLRQHPPLVRPMVARSRTEPHRSSTPLELLFDLCFVVAVAAAARALHHEVVEDHLANGVLGYAMTFFAIWWAWMGFTWFASAYDTDDVPYRLLTLLQISGVLVLAAGVQGAVEDREFATVTLGYVVMRVALVAQWLRVAVQHEPGRSHALRYAVGTTIVQIGWLLRLLLPESLGVAGFLLLVVAELAVPLWAEHELDQPIPWHPGHIAERYGLFTIIVLGETILAAAVAMQAALDTGRDRGALLVVAAGGLVVIFGLWWTAFDRSPEEGLRTSPARSLPLGLRLPRGLRRARRGGRRHRGGRRDGAPRGRAVRAARRAHPGGARRGLPRHHGCPAHVDQPAPPRPGRHPVLGRRGPGPVDRSGGARARSSGGRRRHGPASSRASSRTT